MMLYTKYQGSMPSGFVLKFLFHFSPFDLDMERTKIIRIIIKEGYIRNRFGQNPTSSLGGDWIPLKRN